MVDVKKRSSDSTRITWEIFKKWVTKGPCTMAHCFPEISALSSIERTAQSRGSSIQRYQPIKKCIGQKGSIVLHYSPVPSGTILIYSRAKKGPRSRILLYGIWWRPFAIKCFPGQIQVTDRFHRYIQSLPSKSSSQEYPGSTHSMVAIRLKRKDKTAAAKIQSVHSAKEFDNG